MFDYFLNLNVADAITNASSTSIYYLTFISLVSNGLTNLPSSQIIYLTLGYAINLNNFNYLLAILIGAFGNTLGNLILYKLAYTNSDFFNLKIIKILNIKKELLENLSHKFKNKWWGWLILGKLTPSVKVFVPIVCGLIRISFLRACAIFFIGSFLWASLVTYIGFYFGKQASLSTFYTAVTVIYLIICLFVYLRVLSTDKK
jgi:membrane protein DedA with SNARE-associated domain